MDRVSRLKRQMTGSPERNMYLLLNALDLPAITPDVSKYYVFVYTAKTPHITYDQHPLIMCTGVYNWGFTGFNYHWEDIRQYNSKSNLFELAPNEFEIVKTFPIARFKHT